MKRLSMAAAAVVCLGLLGCPASDPEPPAAPAPEAVERPAAKAKASPQDAVGETVRGPIAKEWFHGTVDGVQGTQLLVFFEVWCPHCRREAPRLQALQEQYADKGLQIVGLTRLSRDTSRGELDQFVSQHGLTFPIGRAPGALARQLRIRGIPAAAVVRNGEVVWRGHPGRLDSAALEGWL